MGDAEKGQLTESAAEIYENFFVPALFLEWADRVACAAKIAPGQKVLDVACGTGVLARELSNRVGPDGVVTGLDRNEGMLDVARQISPEIQWTLGQAESIPYPEASFDVVVSQFGLMFFDDRVASLQEIWRVLRPGGRLAVAVWDKVENTPGYAEMTSLIQDLFGDRVTGALEAPFVLGEVDELLRLFEEAGIPGAQVLTQAGEVRFPSIESWVFTDVKGWTLADMIDDEQYEQLLDKALVEMRQFADGDGRVSFPSSTHIVITNKS